MMRRRLSDNHIYGVATSVPPDLLVAWHGSDVGMLPGGKWGQLDQLSIAEQKCKINSHLFKGQIRPN